LITGPDLVIAPLAILLGGAFAIYLVGRLVTARNEVLAVLTSVVFALALAALMTLTRQALAARAGGLPEPAWTGSEGAGAGLQARGGGLSIATIAVALGLCVSIYCGRYLALDRRQKVTYPLLLLLVAGLVGMVMATDLFSLYLFCELMSVTAYVLVAFRRHTDTAVEAGFKYLILGSAGTLTMLMGTALIYRETGSLAIEQTISAPGPWARIGLAALLAGLGVKSAFVPAHTWLPDAYGRAPSSVSAMLSGIAIESTFYAWLRVGLGAGFPAAQLGMLLMVVSVPNMVVGNGLALVQRHTKRMLAYSTIAHMGYTMFTVGVGLRFGIPDAVTAGFFLIAAHAAMKPLAFLCKGVCHLHYGATLTGELRGTWQRTPLVAVLFTVALVSLAGIPPLAGFAGKWFILGQILRARHWMVYAGLAILLANTVLSLAYYLPVVALLYTAPPPGTELDQRRTSGWMAVPLGALGIIALGMGLWPGPWMQWLAALGVAGG